jgi:hypothetical protein
MANGRSGVLAFRMIGTRLILGFVGANAVSAIDLKTGDAFQPGQLGTRHLLGLMTVAAIILGITAARLRTLGPLETAVVAAHWVVVLSIAGAIFFFTSRRRRRNRNDAGELLLQASCRPMTDRRRTVIKWVLTTLVIVDGILIAFDVYHGRPPKIPHQRLTMAYILTALLDSTIPRALWEGALWAWCLSHWLTNVFRVEFRKHGILNYSGFAPWKEMSGLGWSSVHPDSLIYFHGGTIHHVAIDPASHSAVSEVLENVRCGALA